jgi:hypothetical protein
LLGGRIYLVWGLSILAGAVVHAALLFVELSRDWPAIWPTLIWGPAMIIGLVVTQVMDRQVTADSRAGAVVNESVGFVWKIGGSACLVYFVVAAGFVPDAAALTPAVCAFVYATATAVSAALARSRILKWTAVGWIVFGGAYLAVDQGFARLVLVGVAATMLLIAPGWLLLRRQEEKSRL